jgi:hypothetical protein
MVIEVTLKFVDGTVEDHECSTHAEVDDLLAMNADKAPAVEIEVLTW